MNYHWLSFPGLNIEPFKIDSVAFSIFGFEIAWYGIIMATGIMLGFLLALKYCKKEGVDIDSFYTLILFVIPIAVACARIYYVAMKPELFDSLLDVLNLRSGGIAIYGAVLGGIATILVYSKIKKVSPYNYLDPMACGVVVGQIIGRWGNFMNAEAFGYETTLPWKMGIAVSENGPWTYHHPTFLYESLWNVGVLVLLVLLYRKKKFAGQIFYSYIAFYGFGRMIVEGMRTDSLTFDAFGYTVRASQLVGLLCFIIGIILLIVLSKKSKKEEIDYSPVFTSSESSFDAFVRGDGEEVSDKDKEEASDKDGGSADEKSET